MKWLVRSLTWTKVDSSRLARCEMTAAPIASSSASIDFHGRVFGVTRATCAARSICSPLCTRGSSLHDSGVRLTLSGGRPGPLDGPGEPGQDEPGRQKALGTRPQWPGPQC